MNNKKAHESKAVPVRKILLMQPNYAWISKRTWLYPPYTLGLLKAVIDKKLDRKVETVIFDPNFNNLSEEDVSFVLKEAKPDLIGITSISTEYLSSTKLLIAVARKALPSAIIVFGGPVPTVLIEECMKDSNVNYWILGEGESSFPQLIMELQKETPFFKNISGLAYWEDGKAVVNKVRFEEGLDANPFPDYSQIIGGRDGQKTTLFDYGYTKMKYAPQFLAKKYPFTVTITSRGCPYRCIFCAGRAISGGKVRFRTAENVLAEIDDYYRQGIREVIFLDDHFLANRKRAINIMEGLISRKYDFTWKCVNVTAWLLDKELLTLMRKSGCDFLVVSIESGNERVLKDIIKKPVDLKKTPAILSLAKSLGFDLTVNFVIGLPGETWDEIRETFKYAEKLDVDVVNFHIATPLPKTDLLELCLKEKLIPTDYLQNISEYSGYGKGSIATDEFTPFELQVLRAFEWDRINFSSADRQKAVMRINGITEEDLRNWRLNTRQNLGINFNKERYGCRV